MNHVKSSRQYRDGGYGWIVVTSAFVVAAISDGISYSYGLLLTALVEEFQSTRGQTALAGGLGMCCFCAGGLFAGPLSDRYGYRVVVVAGSLISTVGFVASSFVTEVYHLYFTYGILGGTGFGFMYTPSIICVVQNFDRKRSLANGIAMSGTGAGMFSISALIRYFLDLYGWRGTFMIMGGTSLQASVCGLLLNSPGVKSHRKKEVTNSNSNTEANVHVNMATVVSGWHEQLNTKGNVIQQTKETTNHTSELRSVNSSVISQGLCITCNDTMAIDDTIQVSMETDHDRGQLRQQHLPQSISHIRQLFKDTKSMCGDKRLLAFFIAVMCIAFGFLVPVHLLPDQAADVGIPKDKAFWITSSIGGYIGLGAVVLTDIIGAENMGKGFGLYLSVMTLGYALGGPIGGWIFNKTGNYTYSFILAGVFFITGTIICALPRIWFSLSGTCKVKPCTHSSNK